MIGRLLLRFWNEGIWARVVVVLVLVLVLEINPAPQILVESRQQVDRSVALNDPATAAEAYYSAFTFQPWVTDHLARAAEAEVRAGHYALAESYLKDLETLRPLHPEEKLWLGSIYAGQDRIDEAISTWEIARTEGAVEADSMTRLAEIYIDRGEWSNAARVLESLAARAPADPAIFYRLGLIQALDDSEKAAITLAQAVNLDPSLDERVLPMRANLINRTGDPIDLAYARLGVLYIGLDEYELAEEALSRAIGFNPAYGEAMAYLSYVKARQHQPGLAGVQQALALEPDSPTVHYLVGLTWKEYDRIYEARQAFEEAYVIDPENPAFAVEIASTYRAEGALDWAELWMTEAAFLAGDDIRFQLLLVQFYIDEEYQIEDVGLPLALALVEEYPDNPQAVDALGWAYFQLGQVQKADEQLRLALALAPDLARIQFHYGVLLESNNRIAEALEYYERAALLDPSGPFGALARRAIDRIEEAGG